MNVHTLVPWSLSPVIRMTEAVSTNTVDHTLSQHNHWSCKLTGMTWSEWWNCVMFDNFTSSITICVNGCSASLKNCHKTHSRARLCKFGGFVCSCMSAWFKQQNSNMSFLCLIQSLLALQHHNIMEKGKFKNHHEMTRVHMYTGTPHLFLTLDFFLVSIKTLPVILPRYSPVPTYNTQIMMKHPPQGRLVFLEISVQEAWRAIHQRQQEFELELLCLNLKVYIARLRDDLKSSQVDSKRNKLLHNKLLHLESTLNFANEINSVWEGGGFGPIRTQSPPPLPNKRWKA